ncbi:MAG: FISUMP domain-containing protein [Ferruginibacter sp.]
MKPGFLFTLLASLSIVLSNTAKAQYVPNYDKNGQRSAASKSAEEARNRQIVSPAVTPVKPAAGKYNPPQTFEEKREERRRIDAVIARETQLRKRADSLQKEFKKVYDGKIAKYDRVDTVYTEGAKRATLNNKHGFINTNGDVGIPLIYDDASVFIYGRAAVKLNQKWGFIDLTGKTVIPIQYDAVDNFSFKIAKVKLNGKYGYLDDTGKEIIPVMYDEIKGMHILELEQAIKHDLFAVKLKGLWGFVGRSNNTKIDFLFDDIVSSFNVPVSMQERSYSTYGQNPTPPVATVIKNKAKYKISISGEAASEKTDILTGNIIREEAAIGSFTDVRNNKVYGTIKIGSQIWMSENLNVDIYRSGEKIPRVKSAGDWQKAGKNGKPASCYYEHDETNGSKYGTLYNAFAVNELLAPAGWHIATKAEWEKLTNYLGSEKTAAIKMKNVTGWLTNPTQQVSGFAGLPSGMRDSNGKFGYIGIYTTWWGFEVAPAVYAYSCALSDLEYISITPELSAFGMAVRCIKD